MKPTGRNNRQRSRIECEYQTADKKYKSCKSQAPNNKQQTTNNKQYPNFNLPMTQTFENLNFGHWNLPFDFAQGGEPVEPFGI
jgi:hypothetical protein